jgi:hypothetical protein
MAEAHPRRHLVTFKRTGILGWAENQSSLLSVVSPAVSRFPASLSGHNVVRDVCQFRHQTQNITSAAPFPLPVHLSAISGLRSWSAGVFREMVSRESNRRKYPER